MFSILSTSSTSTLRTSALRSSLAQSKRSSAPRRSTRRQRRPARRMSLLPRTSRERKHPFVRRSGGRGGTQTGEFAGGGFIGSRTAIPSSRDGTGCTMGGIGDPLCDERRTLFFVTLQEGQPPTHSSAPAYDL